VTIDKRLRISHKEELFGQPGNRAGTALFLFALIFALLISVFYFCPSLPFFFVLVSFAFYSSLLSPCFFFHTSFPTFYPFLNYSPLCYFPSEISRQTKKYPPTSMCKNRGL